MRHSLNLPNQITLARLVLAIIFFVLLSQYSQRAPRIWLLDLAWVLFIVAAATDFVDGYIARKWGMTTPLGRVLDPLVDKVLVCGAFILFLGPAFVDAAGHNVTEVQGWMVVVIVGRELLIMGLRGAVSASDGIVVTPSMWGKWKATIQFVAITFAIWRPDVRLGDWYLDQWLMAIAAVITIISAAQYLTRFLTVLSGRDRTGSDR